MISHITEPFLLLGKLPLPFPWERSSELLRDDSSRFLFPPLTSASMTALIEGICPCAAEEFALLFSEASVGALTASCQLFGGL